MNDLFHKIAKQKKVGKYKVKKKFGKNYSEAITELKRKYRVEYNYQTKRFNGVTREFCIDLKHQLDACHVDIYKNATVSEWMLGIKETFDWVASELEGIYEVKYEPEDEWKKELFPQENKKVSVDIDPIPYVFMVIVQNYKG